MLANVRDKDCVQFGDEMNDDTGGPSPSFCLSVTSCVEFWSRNC